MELGTRSREIEDLVAADDLSEATKRLMDLVTDFSTDPQRRREVVAIRRKYNELRSDLRVDGKTDANLRRLSALTDQILEFVDLIRDYDAADAHAQLTRRNAAATRASARPSPSRETLVPGVTSLRHRLVHGLAHEGAALGAIAFEGKGLTRTNHAGATVFELHPIDVTLRAGEITVLVGENGNGKSTLLNIIAGRLNAEGTRSYPLLAEDGADLYTVRGRIGFMPQMLNSWSGRVADNLHFTAGSRGLRGSHNEEEVEFILYRLGLERYASATWGELSGGYKMRFELARILISDPLLLVLDEPLANLDVNTQLLFLNDLRQLIRSPTRPMAAIVSSQHLHEIEAVADHIIFLQDGAALYNGKMDRFGEDREENCYEVACSANREQLLGILEPLACTRITMAGSSFLIHTALAVSKEMFLNCILSNGISIFYFRDISKSTRKLFEVDR